MKLSRIMIALFLFAFALSGCRLRIGPLEINLGEQEPSPGEGLTYSAPVKITVPVGSPVPGTDIRYDGMSEKGAHLTIGGQPALKQKADSVDWHGSPVPDVTLDLTTRIIWFTEEELHLAGTAGISIQHPVSQPVTALPTSPMEYHAPVVYSVSGDQPIPGTFIKYVGPTEQGAELSGIEGYPYRKALDSIVWEGKVKDNVFLRLDLRVVRYTETTLYVSGLATVWIVK